MDMVEEPEQPAHTNEPEEEQFIHNVYIYIAPAQKWLVFTTCDSKINCIMYVFVLAATGFIVLCGSKLRVCLLLHLSLLLASGETGLSSCV